MAHHLKHRYAPHGGGGMGLKANDYLTMPMCFESHASAHSGDRDILDIQATFIFNTLQRAFTYGILGHNEPMQFGEDYLD